MRKIGKASEQNTVKALINVPLKNKCDSQQLGVKKITLGGTVFREAPSNWSATDTLPMNT